MIFIDFYDAAGLFLVSQTIKLNEPRKDALMVASKHCKEIFSYYEDAYSALVLIDNKFREFRRYE